MARRNFTLVILQALDRNLQNLADLVHRQAQSAAGRTQPAATPEPALSPTTGPGSPPAHWLERVRQAAPQFLEPGQTPERPTGQLPAAAANEGTLPELENPSGLELSPQPARPDQTANASHDRLENTQARVRLVFPGNKANSNPPQSTAKAKPDDLESGLTEPESIEKDRAENRPLSRDGLENPVLKPGPANQSTASRKPGRGQPKTGRVGAEIPEAKKFNPTMQTSNQPQSLAAAHSNRADPARKVAQPMTSSANPGWPRPPVQDRNAAALPPARGATHFKVSPQGPPVASTARLPATGNDPTLEARLRRLEEILITGEPPANRPPDYQTIKPVRALAGTSERPAALTTLQGNAGESQPHFSRQFSVQTEIDRAASTNLTDRNWPELPVDPSPENEEGLWAWRKLEHLARLEQEQRGTYGTGRLFD